MTKGGLTGRCVVPWDDPVALADWLHRYSENLPIELLEQWACAFRLMDDNRYDLAAYTIKLEIAARHRRYQMPSVAVH